MPVSQLLRLGRGAVVELDRKVGEPVEIYVNNRLVARGEVMIVDDHLGITMTEIIKGDAELPLPVRMPSAVPARSEHDARPDRRQSLPEIVAAADAWRPSAARRCGTCRTSRRPWR